MLNDLYHKKQYTIAITETFELWRPYVMVKT